MLCLGLGYNKRVTITIPPSTVAQTITLVGRGNAGKGRTVKVSIDAAKEILIVRDNAKKKEKPVGGPLASVMKGRT